MHDQATVCAAGWCFCVVWQPSARGLPSPPGQDHETPASCQPIPSADLEHLSCLRPRRQVELADCTLLAVDSGVSVQLAPAGGSSENCWCCPLQGADAFAACLERECAAGDKSEDGNPGGAAGVQSMGAPSRADKPHSEQAGKEARVTDIAYLRCPCPWLRENEAICVCRPCMSSCGCPSKHPALSPQA